MNSLVYVDVVCGAIVVTVVWWFWTALQGAAKNNISMFGGRRLLRCFIVLACRAFVVWAPEKVEGSSRNASTHLVALAFVHLVCRGCSATLYLIRPMHLLSCCCLAC